MLFNTPTINITWELGRSNNLVGKYVVESGHPFSVLLSDVLSIKYIMHCTCLNLSGFNSRPARPALPNTISIHSFVRSQGERELQVKIQQYSFTHRRVLPWWIVHYKWFIGMQLIPERMPRILIHAPWRNCIENRRLADGTPRIAYWNTAQSSTTLETLSG